MKTAPRGVLQAKPHVLQQKPCASPHCATAHTHAPNQTLRAPAANPPRATQQTPRAVANAGARPQPATPPRVAPTAQRQVANAAPAQRPGYRLLPPTPLAGGRQQIRVAVAGSPKVAGSVDLRPTGGGRAYISNLKVERDFRRQGLANQLMNAALQSARSQGFKAARLEAHPSDDGISPQALVSMYSRMGFRNVGRSSRGNPLMERRL